jgi:hypothetical protein
VTIPEPEVRTTRYEVSCLPPGHVSARSYTIYVKQGDMLVVTVEGQRAAAIIRSWPEAFDG